MTRSAFLDLDALQRERYDRAGRQALDAVNGATDRVLSLVELTAEQKRKAADEERRRAEELRRVGADKRDELTTRMRLRQDAARLEDARRAAARQRAADIAAGVDPREQRFEMDLNMGDLSAVPELHPVDPAVDYLGRVRAAGIGPEALSDDEVRGILGGRIDDVDKLTRDREAHKAKLAAEEAERKLRAELAAATIREKSARAAKTERDGVGGILGGRRPPPKLVDEVAKLDQGSRALENILSRIESSDVDTGPLSSIRNTAAQKLGIADPETSALRADIEAALADYMKAISGAAVSEREVERLKKIAPSFADDGPVLAAKVRAMLDRTAELRDAKLGAYEQAGVAVDGFRAPPPSTTKQKPARAAPVKADDDDVLDEAIEAYDAMSPEQQRAVHGLLSQGVDRVEAVRRVKEGADAR